MPARAKPDLAVPAGRVFGNYELLEQIGQGGMGVVYKARQQNLNRTVALKLMLSGSLATDAEIKRFRAEANAAATLQHPHVVAIHEVGEHEGRHYFSMDYIEGKSLADVVRRTPLPPERAAQYVKTIAEAVHYAHQRGILHRDLKPHNVLIDGNDQPRITDFGLAKQIDVESDLTASGAVVGTPSYMPPEQAAGKRREMTPASDVYSLGAILYDLLTGRPPFRADTPLDTLRQVLDAEPAPPRLLNRKVPRDLETICLKCLAKDPRHRYASAQEFADEVGRFLRREPIHARRVGRVGRIWRWSQRNPKIAGLTALIALILATLGVAAVLFRHDVLRANAHAADLTARLISADLQKMSSVLERAAQRGELLEALQDRNTNQMQQFLDAQRTAVNSSGLRWMGTEPFESWSLFDARGNLLARSPPPEHLPDYFGDRDHFRGACSNAASAAPPRPYVSRVYRSRTDGRHDKFGVSVAVKERDQILGVLLATVMTSPAGILSGAEHNAVLIGRSDPSDNRKEFLIVCHPAYAAGTEAIAVDRFVVDPPRTRSMPYFDPAASRYPSYSGPWLAAVASIPNSPFTVVVQSRDRVAHAVTTTIVASFFLAAAFFAWRITRKARMRG